MCPALVFAGCICCLSTPIPLPTAKQRLEGGNRRAPDANIDFNHTPEVDRDAIVKGVFRFGVDADRMKADDGSDAAEDTKTENEDKSDLLTLRSLYAQECLHWKSQDPYIGNNVEGRGGCH